MSSSWYTGAKNGNLLVFPYMAPLGYNYNLYTRVSGTNTNGTVSTGYFNQATGSYSEFPLWDAMTTVMEDGKIFITLNVGGTYSPSNALCGTFVHLSQCVNINNDYASNAVWKGLNTNDIISVSQDNKTITAIKKGLVETSETSTFSPSCGAYWQSNGGSLESKISIKVVGVFSVESGHEEDGKIVESDTTATVESSESYNYYLMKYDGTDWNYVPFTNGKAQEYEGVYVSGNNINIGNGGSENEDYYSISSEEEVVIFNGLDHSSLYAIKVYSTTNANTNYAMFLTSPTDIPRVETSTYSEFTVEEPVEGVEYAIFDDKGNVISNWVTKAENGDTIIEIFNDGSNKNFQIGMRIPTIHNVYSPAGVSITVPASIPVIGETYYTLEKPDITEDLSSIKIFPTDKGYEYAIATKDQSNEILTNATVTDGEESSQSHNGGWYKGTDTGLIFSGLKSKTEYIIYTRKIGDDSTTSIMPSPPVYDGASISIDENINDESLIKDEINHTLSVYASATDDRKINYQWYQNSENKNTGGVALSGETNSSFEIPSNLTKGEYYYYCVLKSQDCADVTTNVAKITVKNPEGSINGIVKKGNLPVPNATIKLYNMDGTEVNQKETITNFNGEYLITIFEQGLYNIIVTKGESSNVYPINVDGTLVTKDINLPDFNGNANTSVETKPSTPNVTAELNDLFNKNVVQDNNKGITQEDIDTLEGGGSVEIELTAEAKDEDEIADDVSKVKALSRDPKATYLFLDLTAIKKVTPFSGFQNTTVMKELNDLVDVTIQIPEEYQSENLRIFRIHENLAEELKQTENDFGEKFELNEDYTTAKLTIKRFSTFAFSANAVTPNTSTGSGGSSYNKFDIKISKLGNGTISPNGGTKNIVSVSPGLDKTFNFTPEEGYIISDVLVNRSSIGAKTSYTFKNIKQNHTLEVIFEKTNEISNVPIEKTFDDVKGDDWFADSVYEAVQKGWFAGTSDTEFSPNMGTTRGMLITVLWRMENEPKAIGNMKFTDVNKNSYYYDAVAWGAETLVIRGYDEYNYKPDRIINRQELAAILQRYVEFKGKDVSIGEDTNILSYKDVDSIGQWAMSSMQWACGSGLIVGDGDMLMPLSQGTRAQLAAILIRLEGMLSE